MLVSVLVIAGEKADGRGEWCVRRYTEDIVHPDTCVIDQMAKFDGLGPFWRAALVSTNGKPQYAGAR